MAAGASRKFTVMLLNDLDRPVNGTVELSLATLSGKPSQSVRQPCQMDALGSASFEISLPITRVPGPCILKAVAAMATRNRQRSPPAGGRRRVAVE